ncbi:Molybdate-anion transporter [Phytophthora citrophthora]|uniref:Molybdate-anion transporter n=1 Tax=Phytophthora citrophthora TaxID=4793 RepID=A0AAD9LVM3_9STRA|nr:Molybdate-anion transporter [Phytophthora citrophthora]
MAQLSSSGATAGAFQWPVWASACCLGLFVCLLLLHVTEKLVVTRKSCQQLHQEESKADDAAFARFQHRYLVVYGLVMFADWLQGTHMYSLYQSYNMDVGALFLTGFLSSVVFGNFVGLLVDKYGRRRACLVYCALEVGMARIDVCFEIYQRTNQISFVCFVVCQIVINVLEDVPIMTVLLVGRILGGISTSLLFSAFESWMVTEHRKQGFNEDLLGKTFALGSEINGVIAVIAGLGAQVAADAFGDIGPFRAAVVVTAIVAAFVFTWSENYGSPISNDRNEGQKTDTSDDYDVKNDGILGMDAYTLGLCYSLFEGAMYVFGKLRIFSSLVSSRRLILLVVFLWYPTLEAVVPNGDLPSGLVFSSFMLCIAIGGKLFDLVDNSQLREEILLLLAAATSAITLLIPTVTTDHQCILCGFLVFEICVGLISPCCATLRSRYFPTDKLSTTLSLFRLPTNVLVVLGTGGASYLTSNQLYYGCSAVLVVSTGCAEKLVRTSSTSRSKSKFKAQ